VAEVDRSSSEQAVLAETAGTLVSFLFVASAFATFASTLLPKPEGFHTGGVMGVALFALVFGLASTRLPWGRWPLRASLAVVPLAYVLISLHNTFGGDDPYRYQIFYLVVFVWIGMFHGRWTSIRMLPLFLVSYVVPLALDDVPATAVWSVVYAAPILVIVAEVIAWQGERVRRLQRELTHQAMHDPLTGLPNRRMLIDELGRAVARAQRTGRPFGLVYLDIDGFKQLNDRFGHAEGDRALRQLAEWLRRSVRATDLPARLSGDEFAVLLEGEEVEDAVGCLTRRLGAGELPTTPGGGGALQVSIGSVTSDGSESEEELLRRADLAMYEDKRRLRSADL
jgi:diguanylate cyclase (GGDEF)-like protein